MAIHHVIRRQDRSFRVAKQSLEWLSVSANIGRFKVEDNPLSNCISELSINGKLTAAIGACILLRQMQKKCNLAATRDLTLNAINVESQQVSCITFVHIETHVSHF